MRSLTFLKCMESLQKVFVEAAIISSFYIQITTKEIKQEAEADKKDGAPCSNS